MAVNKKRPAEAQIKEFWEWYGIDIAKFTDGVPLERIGEGRYMAHPIDLNNLFKYAVPKVYDMELIKRNRFEGEWQTAYRAKVRLARKLWQPPIADKDPALALFWALWEVKEG